jgi:DNA-binding MarR family transcriptional regulator
MIELSPVDDDLLRTLDRDGRRLGFASTMRNHAAASVVGLHPTDWAALDLLDWAGPLPTGELGSALGLSPAAATSLVDRLEQRRLVTRRSDPDDRRRTIVHADGSRGPDYERMNQQLEDRMAEHARQFTPGELDTVLRFMRGAADVLDAITAQLHRPTSSTPSATSSYAQR